MTDPRITSVLTGASPGCIVCGDSLMVMKAMATGSVGLVFGSPPYEDSRLYGELNFRLKGEAWVSWMVEIVQASLRVSKGLVAFVVEGQTRKFRWSATPVLLMADLHRAGVHLRKPPAFERIGIPGSGGPDWWRNDYEFIVCATNGGRLLWADNTATGTGCAYPVGGAMSNRHQDGRRRNHETVADRRKGKRRTSSTRRDRNGDRDTRDYVAPDVANPGNIIHCKVGGGRMGSKLAHENEAPFPEALVEHFVRCFCPPGGIVLDPFSGSGTTAAVAKQWGRRYIGIDIRQSQIELAEKRIHGPLFAK